MPQGHEGLWGQQGVFHAHPKAALALQQLSQCPGSKVTYASQPSQKTWRPAAARSGLLVTMESAPGSGRQVTSLGKG